MSIYASECERITPPIEIVTADRSRMFLLLPKLDDWSRVLQGLSRVEDSEMTYHYELADEPRTEGINGETKAVLDANFVRFSN